MTWRADDPQGNEAAKCRWDIVPFTRGRGLDLGCGPHKAYPHMIGVDSCKDTELFGIPMKPDVQVPDCADLSLFGDESMDFVFSSHLLEHIEDYEAALAEWWRVIRPGGYLVLYLPHCDLYPRIGTEGANPDHKHDFHPSDIRAAMERLVPYAECDVILDETRDAGSEYSFLQVFRKMEANDPGDKSWQQFAWNGDKRVCIVRYGGFGDMLQAAGLFPLFKAEGYHVTVMTTPKGQDIIRHDPNVDAWIIQDENQVPNPALHDYWAAWERRFTRFVQLSESIEGTLLAMPGRANHAWPHAVRHRHLNRNYLEWTAELAQIDGIPKGRFYPTPAEMERATAQLARHGGDDSFHVVFALAGSSVHKFTPYQDAVIARLLIERPEAVVYLVGDEACKILETGWEQEPRVVCLSGELSIRDTLTLAQCADLVLGPETGVLNAVAFEAMPKIVLLSHSSHENLTKHWQNCIPLAGEVPCYPCHRLHYGSRFCPQDEATGAALCQMAIWPEAIYGAVARAYQGWVKS